MAIWLITSKEWQSTATPTYIAGSVTQSEYSIITWHQIVSNKTINQQELTCDEYYKTLTALTVVHRGEFYLIKYATRVLPYNCNSLWVTEHNPLRIFTTNSCYSKLKSNYWQTTCHITQSSQSKGIRF